MWLANGCPIAFFVIKYKARSGVDWILAAANVSPKQKKYELLHLMPGTVYQLLVAAHTDAGETHQDYVFATLTLTGGKEAIVVSDIAYLLPAL